MQPQVVQFQGQPPPAPQSVTPANQVVFQPPSVSNQPTLQNGTRMNFARDSQKRCGIMQIVLGILSIIIGIATLVFVIGLGLQYIGAGIWCGIFIIITGSFGIVSSRTQTHGLIVACMVLSIFSSCFGFLLFILSAISCVLESIHGLDDSYSEVRLAICALGMITGLAEGVVAIIQSAICCRTTCCKPPQAHPTVVYTPHPFPVQYVLQTQGVVQATNIPTGTSGITMLTPGTSVYPMGYAPVAQQGPMAPAAPATAEAPPAYSELGPIPPSYPEKPPATTQDM